MIDTYAAILASLASGEKPRSQIANELKLSPPEVAGALVTLVSKGQIVVSGKIRVGGKDVSVYADSKLLVAKKNTAPVQLSQLKDDEAIAKLLKSNLYQVWGGYAKLDTDLSKSLAARLHTEC